MNARGRFGLVIPEINSSLDYEFIEGVFAEAKILGYDVIVYTGVFNSIRELRYDNYISGLENIYTLICTQKLDGIIIAAERFHAQDILRKIYDYAVMTSTPCLVLGGETKNAVSMEAEEYSGMYKVTEHLIKEHGCRKLYCLAGVPGHKSSLERLRGFKQACIDSGIKVNDSDIIYGYFWKNVPQQLGIDIIEGRIESPDAVVCCNDAMAVSLTEVLTSNGMRVPEDIKVTGFDGSWDSALNFPSITTIAGRDKQFGADAVCRLYEMITNQKTEQNVCRQYVRFGRSCGCFKDTVTEPHLMDMILRSREKRQFLPTDFIHRMSDNSTLAELSENIDEVGHILGDMEGMDICLCSDWQGEPDNPDNYRQYGYSAVIVPAFDKQEVENTAQNLISAFESGIRERFGDVTLPEFVAFFSQMNSADIYDIEKTVYEAGQSLYEKRKAQEDSFMDYRQQIYRLRRNITAEPQKQWNIDDMARDIGISRSHLQRLYKQLFSVSIKDDVITARINKAMHLLTYTNIRIQEIAELCGYNNDNHLMRQFKEKTGKTALQYRKETRSHEK